MKMNDYKPWKVLGITEAKYYKERYFNARHELAEICEMTSVYIKSFYSRHYYDLTSEGKARLDAQLRKLERYIKEKT